MKSFTTAIYQDEAALVAQAASSPDAFAELYRCYYKQVFNYVRYRCQDLATAEDLTAQIFERLLTKIEAYSPERGPFSAWLFTIARNEVNGHYRSLKRRLWISIESLWRWPSRDEDPEEQVIQGEANAGLLQALNQLSECERDLLGLKFGGQLTNRQIAELTGLSASNTGVILHRAIHRLRVLLSNTEETVISPMISLERSHERA